MWKSSKTQCEIGKRTIVWIFLFGVLVRLYTAFNTYVVNPDGTIYIHQAKAVFYAQWDQLTSCGVNFLSIYPFLIVGAKYLFQDWIIAARAVSMLFGCLALVPLYLVCRLFFQRTISGMILLILVMIPFLVDTCADLVRDPVSWFFVALGLYLFLLQGERPRYPLVLSLSCLAFMIAAWARVEALVLIVVSLFYLCLAGHERKLVRVTYFALPIVPIVLCLHLVMLQLGILGENLIRGQEVVDKVFGPYAAYNGLRASLKELATYSATVFDRAFFTHTRSLLWWIALGALLSNTVKAVFYPFFAVYLVGLSDLVDHLKKDRGAVYLAAVASASLIVLYIHLLHSWQIYTRFVAIFLFSSVTVIGLGLKRLERFAHQRLNLSSSVTLAILGCLIIAFALPKTLGPREKDKVVFKELGEIIAMREGNEKPVKVLASSYAVALVSFYANLNFQGAVCPVSDELSKFVERDYASFVQKLKKAKVDYVVLEERRWPRNAFDIRREIKAKDFKEVGTRYHPTTGEMRLYKIL
jgi:hypothetical protein